MTTTAGRVVPLLLLLAGLPLGTAPARAQIIPPGQEPLIAAMLGKGAPLPTGCSFAGGQVDHGVVRATYQCPYGKVLIQLSHRDAGSSQAIRTTRFAVTVVEGSPHDDLLAAIAALIRSQESEFEWSMLSVGKSRRGFSFARALRSVLLVLLLLALATAAAIAAARAWTARRGPRREAVESLIVAAIVVTWLQVDAAPPAHPDTAVDVALARDCIASNATYCLGHASSALGLVQGQAFTYALAGWLSLGLSMRALCFLAACVHGGTIGLLHHAIARRFGGVAWLASAFASALSVHLTSYPTIHNPSWLVLPLTIAFLATLAITNDRSPWSPFLAGVAFAFGSESHVLLGPFVAAAALIVLITARRPVVAPLVLLGTFVLTEIAISPASSATNVAIVHGWLGAHLAGAALVALALAASVPIQLRLRHATRDDPALRESVAVLLWLLIGAVGLGVLLPWAVSRPPQARYYGAAFPAIVFAAGWLLDALTLRARSARVRALAIVIFIGIFSKRLASADFASAPWFMDDGMALATAAGLVDTSALDIQFIVRPMWGGPVGQVAAAFAGTAAAPVLPPRILRVVPARPEVEPPEGWRRLRLGGRDVLTSAIGAWTHPEEAELCPDPATGEACVRLTRDDLGDVARDAGGALHRCLGLRIARSATRIGEWSRRGTRSLLWRIPLRPTASDATREIAFYDAGGEQIVAIDGTRWTARSDTHAVVERPAPGAAASMTVRTPIADKFEAGVPPLPIELRADEVGLFEAMPRRRNDGAPDR